MIAALVTQALGLGLNYVFTLGVVLVVPVAEAGRLFWYLNLVFMLTLALSWGADSWFVRRRAIAAASPDEGARADDAGEVAVRELVQLSAWVLALMTPLLLGYILFVEQDGAVTVAVFVVALVGYAGCQLFSLDREARGHRVLALYFRAVAPYILATPAIGALWLAKTSVSAEAVLACVALSASLNLLFGGAGWMRQGLAPPVALRRVLACAREYLPNVGTSILNFGAAWLAVFVAKAMLGDAEVAQVNFVLRIATVVAVPIVVVSVTFSARMAQAGDPARVREVYRRSAVASSLVATPVFIGLVALAPFMFERLSPEYDLYLELAAVAGAHLFAMMFGAQYTLFAMTGRISRFNAAIVVSTLIGGVVMAVAASQHGVRGLLIGAAIAIMLKPLVAAWYSLDILRPRPGA